MSKSNQTSYFDGNIWQLLGWQIIGTFITSLTFGICFPWAICKIYEWETKHTVIEGRRLFFDGTPVSLFVLWIKWWVLCLVTLGIYAFWVNIDLKKWRTKHTHFED